MTTFHTIATFARVMRSWAEAIEESDIAKARFYADQIKAVATLIAVDPAYRTIFSEYAGDCQIDNPEDAAECLRAFIQAATDTAIMRRNRGRE